jgi:hypothetical protein
MLVVVGLLGLVVVMAAPRVTAGLRLGGRERTERILGAGVAAARERAVSTGVPHALVVDLDLGEVRIAEVVEGGLRGLRESRYRGVALPRGVRLAVAAGDLRRRGAVPVVAEPNGAVRPVRFFLDDAPAIEVHPLTGLVGPPPPPVEAAAPPPP